MNLDQIQLFMLLETTLIWYIGNLCLNTKLLSARWEGNMDEDKKVSIYTHREIIQGLLQ